MLAGMLGDVGGVLLVIGLGVVAFLIVVLVCVVVLRLLTVVLPPGDGGPD